LYPVPIVGINCVNDGVTFGVIFVPQSLKLFLAAKIPKIKSDAVSVDFANVQTDGCGDLGRVDAMIAFGYIKIINE
jgi:hypothetical protein